MRSTFAGALGRRLDGVESRRCSTTRGNGGGPHAAQHHGREPADRDGDGGNHGIGQRAGTAILNVVVLKVVAPAAHATVAAHVGMTTRTLAGVVRHVELVPARANGYLSYVGSFEYSAREVLDFGISAHPAGGDRLKLHFFKEPAGALWRTPRSQRTRRSMSKQAPPGSPGLHANGPVCRHERR